MGGRWAGQSHCLQGTVGRGASMEEGPLPKVPCLLTREVHHGGPLTGHRLCECKERGSQGSAAVTCLQLQPPFPDGSDSAAGTRCSSCLHRLGCIVALQDSSPPETGTVLAQ